MYMNDDIDIDDLIAEIKDDCLTLNDTSTSAPTLSSDTVNDYILQLSQKLLTSGMESLHQVQMTALQSGDADAIEAYSSLFKSITKGIDTINKINIQQIKNDAAEKIKQIDVESKERIANNQIAAGPQQISGGNTNILVTHREDFLKLIKDAEDPAEDVIDVDD